MLDVLDNTRNGVWRRLGDVGQNTHLQKLSIRSPEIMKNEAFSTFSLDFCCFCFVGFCRFSMSFLSFSNFFREGGPLEKLRKSKEKYGFFYVFSTLFLDAFEKANANYVHGSLRVGNGLLKGSAL